MGVYGYLDLLRFLLGMPCQRILYACRQVFGRLALAQGNVICEASHTRHRTDCNFCVVALISGVGSWQFRQFGRGLERQCRRIAGLIQLLRQES